jgi:uracil permease
MSDLLYELDERPPLSRTLLYAIQWLLIVLPLVTVSANLMASFLGMDARESYALFQRMLMVVGAMTAAQCLWGHRYPVVDGPSAALLLSVAALGGEGLAVVEGGMITGGLILAVAGATGLVGRISWLFTGRVVGVVLLLIPLTFLSYLYPMVTGMTAGYPGGSLSVTLVSVMTSGVIILLSFMKGSRLRNVSILAGIAAGYLVSLLAGQVELSTVADTGWLAVPEPLTGVRPSFTLAGTVSFLLAYVALLINSMGSLMSVSKVVGEEGLDRRLERGLFVNGASGVISALMGSLGTVSYSQSPGVILVTRVGSRFPVLACGILLMALACFSKLAALLSTIPDAVVGAALLVTLAAMLGLGISMIASAGESGAREYMVAGLPVLLGVSGSMLPGHYLNLFPTALRGLVGNGLIVGIVVVLLLEHVVLRSSTKSKVQSSK